MSSEIYEFDRCFFNDPFSLFNDSSSSIDILQAFQEHNFNYTPLIPSSSSPPPLYTQQNIDTTFDEIDRITPTRLSTSPPSHQLENLSLYHMGIPTTSSNEALDFRSLEVKTKETQLPVYNNNYYYGEPDNPLKMMQRSYSSNSFQQPKSNGVLYQPKFDGLVESLNLHSEVLTSPMRRVCSTGDLQSPKVNQTRQRLSSSPLATESSFMEEANFKVGRYNAEERKEKILKYRAKRTQRNFNKIIKYACRKTLADNRPRVRGRFARNDEPGENPKTTTFHDEDDIWMDGLHEDGYERTIRRGRFSNTYPTIGQFSNTYPTIGQFSNTYPTIGQFQQFSFIHN